MQVRQHTEHKRTFMFLEQVVLKYNAASTCINIKDIHEVTYRPCRRSFCAAGNAAQQHFTVLANKTAHMCPPLALGACLWLVLPTDAVASSNQHMCVMTSMGFQCEAGFNGLFCLLRQRESTPLTCLQGVDFFFSKRSHAQRFLDFLQGIVPLRYRTDKQLVSHNEQNATYNYKYTFSVEIVPICKVMPSHPSSLHADLVAASLYVCGTRVQPALFFYIFTPGQLPNNRSC